MKTIVTLSLAAHAAPGELPGVALTGLGSVIVGVMSAAALVWLVLSVPNFFRDLD